MLTADQILGSPDIAGIEKVAVPEWGGDVYVKVMTGAERDRWELTQSQILKDPVNLNIRASLCAVTLCDEKGNRLFSDFQIDELGNKSAIVLDRIFDVARKLNKLTNDDLDELEKNY